MPTSITSTTPGPASAARGLVRQAASATPPAAPTALRSTTVSVDLLAGGASAAGLFRGYDASGRMTSAEEELKKRLDPDKRAALEEAAEANARLAQTAEDTRASDRRARLREKIEEIKRQLQLLRAMAASDPKGAAKQAARLARELAQAAKELGAGGGGGGTAGAATAATTGAPATAATAGTAVAAAGTASAGDAAKGLEAGAMPLPGSAAGPSSTAMPGEATGASGETGTPAGAGADPADPSSDVLTTSAVGSGADEDMREAKTLAEQLKAIVERARLQARRDRDKDGEKAIDDEARTASDAVATIAEAGGAGGAGLFAAATVAMPAVPVSVSLVV